MNRSGLLIPNITYLVTKISFKLSNELASALTIAILTKEYLVTFNNEATDLIKVISEKLSTPEDFSKTLLTNLIGQFDKVKLQASTTQTDKLKLLRIACAASNFLKTDPETLVSSTVDFIFGLKEQTEIDAQIYNLLSRSSTTSKLVGNVISKVQFSSQV